MNWLTKVESPSLSHSHFHCSEEVVEESTSSSFSSSHSSCSSGFDQTSRPGSDLYPTHLCASPRNPTESGTHPFLNGSTMVETMRRTSSTPDPHPTVAHGNHEGVQGPHENGRDTLPVYLRGLEMVNMNLEITTTHLSYTSYH